MKTNVLCLISMILSLVGLLIFGMPLGIAGIITGIIGVVRFKPEEEKGRGMGIAGIAVGAFDLVATLLFTGIIAGMFK